MITEHVRGVYRSLYMRAALVAIVLTACIQTPARAQNLIAIAGGTLFGFTSLSTIAMVRLLERGRPLSAGDSVRMVVRATTGSVRYAGRARAMTRDSITLEQADTTWTIARRNVASIRAYRGTERKWAQGWAVGLLGGAAIGALEGYSLGGSPPECEALCMNGPQTVVFVGIVGGMAGSALGTAVGTFIEGAHWRSVRERAALTDTLRVSFAPIIGPIEESPWRSPPTSRSSAVEMPRQLGVRIDIPVR
jgi:hypothetical protein